MTNETNWDRELRVGEFRGFRAWTLRRPWAPLRSLSWSYEWTSGVNEAHCLTSRGWRNDSVSRERCMTTHPDTPYHLSTCLKEPYHTKPTAGCGCGFWAYFNRDFWGPEDSRVMIFGVIRGWGSCRVGNLGFRSQFAQIEALAFHAPEKKETNWDDENMMMEVLTNLMQRYPNAEVYPTVDQLLGRHDISRGRHD